MSRYFAIGLALEPLLRPEFVMGMAGMKIVGTREEGLALVKLTLQERAGRRGRGRFDILRPEGRAAENVRPLEAVSRRA